MPNTNNNKKDGVRLVDFEHDNLRNKRAKKRTTYSATTEVADIDGVLKEREVKHQTVSVTQEPPFVKLYLHDLGHIVGLSPGPQRLLIELAKYMTWSGQIALTKIMREQIADTLNITYKSVNNYLTKLTEKPKGAEFPILVRMGQGTYMINPNYIAKGEWRDVVAKKEKFRLIIEYGVDGGKEIKTDLPEEAEHQYQLNGL
ncbi:hypothetical protein [Photobacterium rosenbergii]|uniref:hypothetical protein n=1 Tax=Photobacterium rosenbergii TaxID=294936 RepID=UPI001C99FE14|nr:hypothetical protein [Photobacterium rosenbergii]MBY5949307.1 hypothetical protein [Photobacterium rosenbergii]